MADTGRTKPFLGPQSVTGLRVGMECGAVFSERNVQTGMRVRTSGGSSFRSRGKVRG